MDFPLSSFGVAGIRKENLGLIPKNPVLRIGFVGPFLLLTLGVGAGRRWFLPLMARLLYPFFSVMCHFRPELLNL